MLSKLLFSAAVVSAQAASKVKVDLYYESLCPYCRDLINGSFAEAYKAEGFLDMAEVNYWPYGNAHETQTESGEWDFSCQHGDAECQYNMIETCVVNLVDCPYKAYDILSCMEKKDRVSKYEAVTKSCAPDTFDQIWACYTGSDVNGLQH